MSASVSTKEIAFHAISGGFEWIADGQSTFRTCRALATDRRIAFSCGCPDGSTMGSIPLESILDIQVVGNGFILRSGEIVLAAKWVHEGNVADFVDHVRRSCGMSSWPVSVAG